MVLFVGLSGVFVGGLNAFCWLWLENNRFWQLFLLWYWQGGLMLGCMPCFGGGGLALLTYEMFVLLVLGHQFVFSLSFFL